MIINLIVIDFFFSIFGSTILKNSFNISLFGADYLLHFIILVLILFFNNKIIIFQKRYLVLFFVFSSLIPFYYVISNYIISPMWFVIGCFIIFIPLFTTMVFINVELSYKKIIELLEKLGYVIHILSLSLLVSFIFGTDLPIIGVGKNEGISVSIIVFNVMIQLVLYSVRKKFRYMAMVGFTYFVIFLSKMLKSLFVATFIIIFFIMINYKLRKKICLIFITLLLFFVFIFLTSPGKAVVKKFNRYVILYALSSERGSVPRNALFIASYKIAKDFFPLGSGPSTFGSYPVNITYNDIYYDYGLSRIQGLTPEAVKPEREVSNFLLDNFWPSLIGELGFLGFWIYVSLLFFPIISIKKYLKRYKNKDYLYIIPYTIMFVFVIQGLFLNVGMQISFIIFYSIIVSILSRRSKIERLLAKERCIYEVQ